VLEIMFKIHKIKQEYSNVETVTVFNHQHKLSVSPTIIESFVLFPKVKRRQLLLYLVFLQ